MGLEHLVAQTRAHRDADVGPVELLACAGLGLHLLIASQTGLVLGLTGLGAGAHPLELGLHALGELGVAVALSLDTRGLGLQIRGVVALVGIKVAAVDLADPLGNVVQEVAIVCDGKHRALVVVQEVLEPQDRLGVQVVGGLIEQQQVGSFEQQLAQGHATALAAGKHIDRHVGIGQLQGIHSLAELGIDIPAVGGIDFVLELAHLGHEGVHVTVRVAHLLADLIEAIDLGDHVAKCHAHVLDDGLVVVERRLLLQDTHGVAGGKSGIAVGDFLDAGHDLEQGRLAHTVRAHDADLGTGIEAQGHVVKDHLVAMSLASLIHLVDKLCHLPVLSFLPAVSLFLFRFSGNEMRKPALKRNEKGARLPIPPNTTWEKSPGTYYELRTLVFRNLNERLAAICATADTSRRRRLRPNQTPEPQSPRRQLHSKARYPQRPSQSDQHPAP